ncbi:MAG: cyclase family protein [Dehalococcoidia bacterium]|nr:cyclase family protein [Dehalococcoidia bacterium]
MSIYDISVTISEDTHVYPGDAGARITPTKQISKGRAYNLSALHLGSHVGTHVDAPRHFFQGAQTVDALPLDVLMGEAWVCHFPDVDAITDEALAGAGIPPGAERLLIRTRNSGLWRKRGFQEDFAYLTPEAARWMVARGIKLVGFDYLSLEKYGVRQAGAHMALLGAGVIILEGIDLSQVTPGDYELVCLPLKLKDGDGAPARAVLVKR